MPGARTVSSAVLTPFSLWEKGWGRGVRGKIGVEIFRALLWTGGTAEHLIHKKKEKQNDAKAGQALSPALSQREREKSSVSTNELTL